MRRDNTINLYFLVKIHFCVKPNRICYCIFVTIKNNFIWRDIAEIVFTSAMKNKKELSMYVFCWVVPELAVL